MSGGWKPGDVAMLEVGCWANRHVGVFVGAGWRYDDDEYVDNDPAITTARRLVVIDPEDAEQVERLRRIIFGPLSYAIHDLADDLREFASPAPRIEEPQGPGLSTTRSPPTTTTSLPSACCPRV